MSTEDSMGADDAPKSAEIIQLPTAFNRKFQSTISTLERVLEQARAGAVESVAIVVVRPTGFVDTTFSESDKGPALAGGVALLQSRILRALEEGR